MCLRSPDAGGRHPSGSRSASGHGPPAASFLQEFISPLTSLRHWRPTWLPGVSWPPRGLIIATAASNEMLKVGPPSGGWGPDSAWLGLFTTPSMRKTPRKFCWMNHERNQLKSVWHKDRKRCLPLRVKIRVNNRSLRPCWSRQDLLPEKHKTELLWPPSLHQVTGPYFCMPSRGKTFSPIVASNLFHSIRLNLGMIIRTGGVNNCPFVKAL